MTVRANVSSRPSFIVEGNIGVGKSTFLALVKKHLDVEIILEPHEKWQQVGGTENLLDMFYKDTPRWAYTFQTYAFVTRVLEQEQALLRASSQPLVFERSVFSDRYCFAKNCFELGYMNALEWKLYQEWFSWLVEQYVSQPTGFIYLRAEPELCYSRIAKRNRDEETGVSSDYLRALHQKHEDWLVHKKDLLPRLSSVPVLVLPCDEDFENTPSQAAQHMDSVWAFMQEQVLVAKPASSGVSLPL